MPVARVVITKEIPFRAGVERFSNGYKFNLPDVTQSVISALAAALITMERPLHANDRKFVYAVGGLDAPGSEAVYAEEFPSPLLGTLTGPTEAVHAEVCMVYALKRRQRVYSRKWYHVGYADVNGSRADMLDATYRTSKAGALAKLTDGTLPGGARVCWPDGTQIEGTYSLDQWLRIRQFDRRSPRPIGSGVQGG